MQSLLDLRDIIVFDSIDIGFNLIGMFQYLLKHMDKYPQKESYAGPFSEVFG